MLKIFVCISIITVFAFIGNDVSKKYKRRYEVFSELVDMFRDIKVFVCTTKLPVSDYFISYEPAKNSILFNLHQNIRTEIQNGQSCDIKERFMNSKNVALYTFLKVDERQMLSNLLAFSKKDNIDDVKKGIEELIFWLKEKLDVISSTEIKKGGVFKKVSILAAVIAVICII